MSQKIAEVRKPRYVFHEGDLVLFIDRKRRRYMVRLSASGTFHTHIGAVAHADILGKEEGCRVYTSGGHSLLAMKPTLGDFVLEMPRIAQVIYPKDLGIIIIYGDIFPGARVLEAGTGSGSLTLTLLRAIGQKGHVYTYEVRSDMAERARKNIQDMHEDSGNLSMKMGNVYEGIEERDLDRIVLDLPEPWWVVPHAAEALVPGGIFLSFLPTILQVHELVESLRASGVFDLMETMEVLLRTWSVQARSVRPDHRMVAHTGFITVARKCSPPLGAKPTSDTSQDSLDQSDSSD